MDDTVRLKHGTVESYEEMMHRAAADGSSLYLFAIGVIRNIATGPVGSDTERIERIRAVLVARDRVDGNPAAVALARLQSNEDKIKALEAENREIRKDWIADQLAKPAEPKPEPDDPTGLAYSRADEADDPTPVSPARVPMHTGAVVDGGALVDETGCPNDWHNTEVDDYPEKCPGCGAVD